MQNLALSLFGSVYISVVYVHFLVPGTFFSPVLFSPVGILSLVSCSSFPLKSTTGNTLILFIYYTAFHCHCQVSVIRTRQTRVVNFKLFWELIFRFILRTLRGIPLPSIGCLIERITTLFPAFYFIYFERK